MAGILQDVGGNIWVTLRLLVDKFRKRKGEKGKRGKKKASC